MSAFYLATSWLNQVQGARLRDRLKAAGHTCSYDWIAMGDEGEGRLDVKAHEEIDGVKAADVFVLLLPGRLGAHTELGAAIACGVPVVVIGWANRDCIFYDYPGVVRGTVREALAMLRERDRLAP